MSRIIIIGAGPGGYETAVAAAKKGFEVTIVSDGNVGGVCLNEGCIPTKALCRNAEILESLHRGAEFGLEGLSYNLDFKKVMERKDAVVSQLRSGVEFLLGGKGITLLRGKASFSGQKKVSVALTDGGVQEVEGDYVIVATGSVSAMLPIPGKDAEGVITSREILELQEVPKRLCVIGGGVIGLEFASVFNAFGSEVSVVEYFPNILPRFDTDLSKRLKQALGKKGISIETGAAVSAIEKTTGGLAVKYTRKDKEYCIEADKVLMAVGRRPNISSMNFADAGVETTPKGIPVDGNMRTNVPWIYAIGDITGGMMLAHTATFQGIRALTAICKAEGIEASDDIDFSITPAAVFTSPEAATVGLSEDECVQKGLQVKCLKSFFRANGKALALGEPEGFCKIVVGAGDGRILGCHLFGAHSADLVQEMSAIMKLGATVKDVRSMIHAHPTLSEVLQAAFNE